VQKSQKIVKTSISQFQGRWSTARIAIAQILTAQIAIAQILTAQIAIAQILTAIIVIAQHFF
jgi:hypothetical protein